MLDEQQIAAFERDGYVRVAGAVDRATVEACVDELWAAMTPDRHDRATWTEPVVRLGYFASPPFRAAANGPLLHAAFDQLAGPGRWLPRGDLGTFPVRFPSATAPGDDGWHVEAGFAGPDGSARVDLGSRTRALLMLFLFSDTGSDDAPTRIRVGSHRDVSAFLVGAGDDGRDWLELCGEVVPATAGRPEAAATGAAGDVYLCHPFLVHAAQPHRGREPRFMAQPPLVPVEPLRRTGVELSPVERAGLA